MVTVKRITPNRYDVFLSANSKYVGDMTKQENGFFYWSPVLPVLVHLEADMLRSIADALDKLNAEWAKTVNKG